MSSGRCGTSAGWGCEPAGTGCRRYDDRWRRYPSPEHGGSIINHAWNPEDYHRHSTAQAHWAHELIGKLNLSGNERVLDLGCGEGKVTAEIAARLPAGSVLGLDLSCDMIAFAREHLPPERYPNLRFVEGDMLDLPFDEEFDVVFSNAALHWVPDHGRVFSGIVRSLRPGGRVLLQMGGKGNAAPVMAIADEMLAEEPWKDLFDGPAPRYAFYGPEEERRSLAEAGLVPVRVELIGKDMAFDKATDEMSGARAPQVRGATDEMSGARAPQVGLDGLMGWVRTTWHLYLDPLPEEVRPAFVTELASRYAGKYPSPDGHIHVPMMRLEIEAVKE